MAFDALGDRWSILTLRAVYDGHHTFTELRDSVGITDGVLAARLARLTGSGMLDRLQYHARPPRWQYHRSDIAVELWQAGIALWLWDQAWDSPSLDTQIRHVACGNIAAPAFGCASCGTLGVTTHDVQATVADGLPDELNLSSATRTVRLAALPYVDAVTLLGDHWSTAMLAVTLFGARSFSEYRAVLQRISTATLSERLRLFVVSGLLETAPGNGGRRKVYRMTQKSRDFFPVFAAMNEWAGRFADDTGLRFEHVHCGSELIPRFWCDHCHRVMDGPNTTFETIAPTVADPAQSRPNA
ncbi:hypothetical protein GCM10027298_03540 [Epidermidibacterium keratini]